MTSENDKLPIKSNDPLHGVTLEVLLTRLEKAYGFDALGRQIKINCFNHEPSIKSSLKFLRKTPWARKKVEDFYCDALRKSKIKLN
ncbi:VF530 family DNA-binding protein [Candidatus Omnitrophota bacterium]